MNKDKEKLYIVYDWACEEVKIATYSQEKAYSKIGQDVMAGDEVTEYRFIEINLNEAEE